MRHPELPTRSRDLLAGSWGVGFSVEGATLVSLLGTILPFHLTVINYKIFGKKLFEQLKLHIQKMLKLVSNALTLYVLSLVIRW